MTTITVTRDENGKLGGFTEKDKRSYGRFKKAMEELQVGELMTVTVWFPRNSRFHRLHFALVKALLESQEQFDDIDPLRKWLCVGAGHAVFMPGPNGRMVAIPKSISF